MDTKTRMSLKLAEIILRQYKKQGLTLLDDECENPVTVKQAAEHIHQMIVDSHG